MDDRFEFIVLISGALHLLWVGLYVWYLKIPHSILCGELLGGCPASRPLAPIAFVFVPPIGIVLAVWLPVKLVGAPYTGMSCWQYLGLGCLSPFVIVAAMTLLFFLSG